VGSPTSLLGNARAFARDYARDEMPPGYLWDVLDLVPSIIDTTLTGRGAWAYGCAATGFGDVEAGILATYRTSEQLLVQTTLGHVMRVNNDGGGDGSNPPLNTLTDLGATWRSVQNPVQLGEDVIHFDRDGTHVPQLWREGAILSAYADMGRPRVGTVWKGSLVSGGGQGPTGNDEGSLLRFSVAGADLATAASYDVNSNVYTSARITGLQAMRSMVLIFHAGSIERLRGGPFPNTAAGIDGRGLVLDTLSDRVGCINPQSIAVWNDQVIFADEHGVHMTDGAVVRNLTTQGGISTYWRLLYEGAKTIAASTFLDYYVITLRHPPTRPPLPDFPPLGDALLAPELLTDRPPIPPLPPDLPPIRPPVPEPAPDTYNTTLVVDLNRKGWFRMSNMNSLCFISSSGSSGMERLWGGLSGYARLGRFGPVFYPPEGVEQIDGNTIPVLPRFETPWYRLGQEGRKRVRFAYLSYDCMGYSPVTAPVRVGYLTSSPTGSDYAQAGVLPLTNGYRRVRLPINKAPYGIAFYVETIAPTGFIRVYDLAVEAQAVERSRV